MEKKDIFKQYLESNEILIFDKNPASRTRLIKIMYDLGAARNSVHTGNSIAEAEEIINTKKIGIVLSDYYVGGGSGFDLFKIIREKNIVNRKLCLILVTSNISQTAVAKAAEEDVDSFIIKPYTIQSIQENLISTISLKARPTDYLVKIDEGKALIGIGKYEKALTVLNGALRLHPRPSLALFYIGQAEYLKNHVEKAEGSYNQGLGFNNIHYKCLVGLHEVFMRESRFDEAYQVVKKIANYFPANPDRLTQIVRLAIQTKNYDDMQMYYEIFTSLQERTDVLTNYIGSGMYISGKHCMRNNDVPRALQFFDNIAISCSEHTKFIRAMITLLIEYNLADEAAKYLSRFPVDFHGTEDFLVCDYLVSAKSINDGNRIVRDGMALYNRNIRDYDCMRILIENMRKTGVSQKKIEPIEKEISKLWPERLIEVA